MQILTDDDRAKLLDSADDLDDYALDTEREALNMGPTKLRQYRRYATEVRSRATHLRELTKRRADQVEGRQK